MFPESVKFIYRLLKSLLFENSKEAAIQVPAIKG